MLRTERKKMTEIKHPEITVKLIGTDGNVFNLIGLCIRAMKLADLDKVERDLFISEVLNSKSYEQALATMLEWFDIE